VSKQAGYKLIEPELAEHRAAILKALGNPVRLRIVACLCARGELPVGDLADSLGLPQSTISRQLSWLRLAGLVGARSERGYRHYSIAMPQVRTLLQCLADCRRPH
jgi:DNA-binding transcriptional ArsR family regulator